MNHHFFLALMLGVLITSCTSSTDPADIRPQAPTTVRATSVNASTVALTWEAASQDQSRTGFTITISGTGVDRDTTINDPAARTVNVSGLVAGTLYTFSVYALNGTTTSASAASVQWAPALRYTMKVYEPMSENGNGIQLSHPVSLLLPAAFKWDLCVEIRNDSLLIGCPLQSVFARADASGLYVNGDSVRRTVIGRIWDNVSSLESTLDGSDVTSGSFSSVMINAEARNASGTPFAFVVRTQSGNYAKVLVKSTNGSLLQGLPPDRYLDLEIVYQPLPGQAFLKKQG